MAQDNASIVRGFVEEVITNGNIEAAAHYVWEDVVEQVPLPGQGPGLDGLKDILRAMRSGFPDIVFSIQEQVAEHDKVASRFEWTGISAFPQQEGLCASGELSLIALRMAELRTPASLWILLA